MNIKDRIQVILKATKNNENDKVLEIIDKHYWEFDKFCRLLQKLEIKHNISVHVHDIIYKSNELQFECDIQVDSSAIETIKTFLDEYTIKKGIEVIISLQEGTSANINLRIPN